MRFDDHEIWGAPVREPELPAEQADLVPPPQTAGRLYRSAGSAPHPDAIVALPTQRNTAVHVIDSSIVSTPAPAAPVVAPVVAPEEPEPVSAPMRVSTLQDPALVDIMSASESGAQADESRGSFDDWFRNSGVIARIPPVHHSITVVRTASIGTGTFALAVAVVTLGTALISAFLTASLLPATGVALFASTAVCAWMVRPSDRWAAWVLPTYLLMLAVLIGGQFTSGAPGASILGQIMLVVTSFISLAPWLAVATVVGAALPAIRKRRS